ncbi:MAG: hypothetical protein FWC80_05085 [Firmicutes bacterium]|nr:hypothetical protein [Bacillota bacterium]
MKLITKKQLPKITALSLIFAAIFLLISFAGGFGYTSRAEAQAVPRFERTSLGISNPHFSDTSGTDATMSPTGWTGSVLGDNRTTNMIRGVVDLSVPSFAQNYRELNMAGYSDGSSVPYTLFGHPEGSPLGNRFENSDKNALLINTRGADGAYRFESSTMNLDADSFFRISVWVRTSNFVHGGAFVTLDGLDRRLVFDRINTVTGLNSLNRNNDWGWQQFAFYVATPSFKPAVVTLNLQVGDYAIADDDREIRQTFVTSNGWALFDTVSAYQICATTFRTAMATPHFEANTDNGFSVRHYNRMVFDGNQLTPNLLLACNDTNCTTSCNYHEYVCDGNWDFSAPMADGWSSAGLDGGIFLPVVDSVLETPGTSRTNTLTIVSPTGTAIYSGIKSSPLTINRHTFYRLGVWVNTTDIEGGSGASVVLRANRRGANPDDPSIFDQYLVETPQTHLSGSQNSATFGWEEAVFFIRGSSTRTIDDLSIELALGQDGARSSGIARFTGIRLQRIDPREFDLVSGGGTLVNLDGERPPTSITNGHFNEVDAWNPRELPIVNGRPMPYPLPVSGWTQGDASNSQTAGFPSQDVNVDRFVGGVVHTDALRNSANAPYLGTTRNVIGRDNLLMIHSPVETAVFYRSPAMHFSPNSFNRITVTLSTLDIQGYGANLVLKRGNNIIGTIQQINTGTTGINWQEFSFYVSNDTIAQDDITVEIWLGLGDRQGLDTKLASGHIFVDSIELEPIDHTTFTARRNNFVSRSTPPSNFALYEFGDEHFTAFDRFSDSFVRIPFNWTMRSNDPDMVRYGIFNATSQANTQSLFAGPSAFEHTVANDPYVLILQNTSRAYSTLSSFNRFSLEPLSFYRLTVSMKVFLSGEVTDNTVGARLELAGLPTGAQSFENIRPVYARETITSGGHRIFVDTLGNQINPQDYSEYSFYIRTDEVPESVFVDIGLGGRLPLENVAGVVYVNSIIIENITGIEFDAVEDTCEDGYFVEFDRIVDLRTIADVIGDDENDGGGFEIQWWLFPSIIFTLLMVVALVGIIVRKMFAKAPAKVAPKKITYDRQKTLNRIHGETTGETVAGGSDAGENFEMFDDRLNPEEKTPKADKKPKAIVDEFDDVSFTDEASDETVATDTPKEKVQKPAYTDEFED